MPIKNNQGSDNIPLLRFPEFTGDWERKKLGEVMVEGKLGGNYENSEANLGVPVMKMGNINRGEINLDKVQYLPKEELYNEGDILKEGDLLFNTRNTLELVGKVAIWRNELPFALYNSNLMRISFNDLFEKSNRFMNAYFNTAKSINQLYSFATGTTSVAAIYGRDLVKFEISFPSLPEQTKIATFLTAVDEKIQALKKKHSLLEQYKKGVMQKLFSQEIRFKDKKGNDFPGWEEMRLEEICKIARSGGTPTSTNKSFYNGDIPFLSISDMTSQGKYLTHTSNHISKLGLENSSSWIVPANSLIYSMYASVGFVAINKIPIATSQAVLNLIIKEQFDLEFMYYTLVDFQKNIAQFITTGTQGNLNAQSVKNFELKIPSLKEQIKISNFLSNIDEKINQIQTQVEKTENWKKGLLQKMFC